MYYGGMEDAKGLEASESSLGVSGSFLRGVFMWNT